MKHLKFEASHDSLLRIWNRRAIMDLLSTELSRAKRLQTPLSVFFADLDFFKRVNDSYGHLVGDDVLRSVAEKMSSAVREYDHVGRYGGEEFLVVLPNCTAEAAREVAERVRQHISDEPIVMPLRKSRITVSIGVSQWHSGQEVRDLLHRADVALYRAKQNGRNRVEVESASETDRYTHGKASGSTSPPQPSRYGRHTHEKASGCTSQPRPSRSHLGNGRNWTDVRGVCDHRRCHDDRCAHYWYKASACSVDA